MGYSSLLKVAILMLAQERTLLVKYYALFHHTADRLRQAA